jgi:hypothetical protein
VSFPLVALRNPLLKIYVSVNHITKPGKSPAKKMVISKNKFELDDNCHIIFTILQFILSRRPPCGRKD